MQLGNKTECSLLGFVLELGQSYQAYRDGVPEEKFVHVYTFNSVRKSMSTVVKLGEKGGYRLYSKGASEIVLGRCSNIITTGNQIIPYSSDDLERTVKEVIEPMASDGLRTIGMAYRDFPLDQGTFWHNHI